MCGICGVAFADNERPAEQDVLARMTASLHHRGPDGRGFFSQPGIGLGMTRLSIVDLEHGDQPISSEDGNVTLICNGEIYNSAELRDRLIARGHRFRTHSDVEVIVHLYEDHGIDCVHQLRGMFAFAIWDETKRRLMLARDRLGIKPLHYALTADACYFASEQKALLASGAISRDIDLEALGDFAALGVTKTPRTFLAGVSRLAPGHWSLYQDGKLTVQKYWDVDFTPQNEHWKPHEWADALRDRMIEAVRLHMMSDVPVGSWLSAGIDSSSIVSIMNHLGHRSVPTFTLAFDYPDYDEVEKQRLLYDFPGYSLDVGRVTCGREDIHLLPEVVWHSEDPVIGGVEIPRFLLAKSAAQRVKVVLTGEGSDEILAGYEFFRLDKFIRPFTMVPGGIRRRISALAASRFPRGSRVYAAPRHPTMERYLAHTGPMQSTRQLLSPELRDNVAKTWREVPEIDLPDAFEEWDPLSQLQYHEMKIRLPDRVVSILDRVSMANSLEARVPFLDHVVVEFCAGIPASVKLSWFNEKKVLRDAMKHELPKDLVRRKKRGLAAPLRHWLTPLPDFAKELLSESALRDKGYFDPAAVRSMIEKNRRDEKHRGGGLMAVLMVQLWDEFFIRGRAPESPYPSDFFAKNSF